MGTAERRNEMFKYLCRVRHAKISDLAQMFGVSEKTISRDIFELEMMHRVTLEIKRGRYGGGVHVPKGYNFGQLYLYEEEIALLIKLQKLAEDKLSNEENNSVSRLIKKYTNPAI